MNAKKQCRPLWEVCENLYFPRKITVRSDKTKYQYRSAIRDFARAIGREPTTADLDDDAVTLWMVRMLNSGLAVDTVRERAGRILTLWNWLARRGVVKTFPTVSKPPPPEPNPIAMQEDDLRRLFASAGKERGRIAGVPAGLWWVSFFGFVWCTSERRSAALAMRPQWIDFERRLALIPASVRKGGRKHACYPLWPELMPLLRDVIAATPPREFVWPWPYDEATYFNRFGRIAADAGWPDDRKHKTHALRVSHATHRKLAGGDPTKQLMHGDPGTTDRHYLDKTYFAADDAKLFIPWQRVDPPETG